MAEVLKITFKDIRQAIKAEPDMNQIRRWEAGALPKPLLEMADDISGWFDPSQRWRLTYINGGFINLKADKEMALEKEPKPSEFSPIFHFEAGDPPIAGGRFWRMLGTPKELDFRKIFSEKFRFAAIIGLIKVDNRTPANTDFIDIAPDKIGSVYPLREALEKLTSPFYLDKTTISAVRGQASSLAVRVTMRDLIDYVAGEKKKYEGIENKLKEDFL